MRLQPQPGWWLLLPILLGAIGALIRFTVRRYRKDRVLFWPWVRRGSLLFMLLLMIMGFSVPGGSSSPGIANLDVVFALDTTASMGAQDYHGNKLRIDGAKQDILDIGSALKGAHFAIVTFDSKADVVLPFTADYATFTSTTKILGRELYNTSNGSSLDKPLSTIEQQLKNSKAAYPDRKRILFYLSDGEQTSKNKLKSYAPLANYLDAGAVMGYGTANGAKMVKYSGFSTKGTVAYIQTPNPQTKKFVPAISKLNENNLKAIASQLDVLYQNRNQGGSVVSLLNGSKTKLQIDRSKHVTHYLNLYWLFAIPFTALLFWEWQILFLKTVAVQQIMKREQYGE